MFSPFYAQNKRANSSSSLFSVFFKDDIRSRRSLKKSEESNSHFEKSELHSPSFFLKIRAIPTKNQRVNSQPCLQETQVAHEEQHLEMPALQNASQAEDAQTIGVQEDQDYLNDKIQNVLEVMEVQADQVVWNVDTQDVQDVIEV